MFSSFFFNDTATTEIYTLSLHDALPISEPRPRPTYWVCRSLCFSHATLSNPSTRCMGCSALQDRKSTRLNSSHLVISYAVFCLKKKNEAVPVGTLRSNDSTRLPRSVSCC